MKNFLDEIRNRVLVFDGSKGYMLQQSGLMSGECGEEWNIKHPEIVSAIYRAYKDAGSDVIQTNTFAANRIHLKKFSLEEKLYEINYKGARMAREIMGDDGYVAASIAPTGKLFEPSGDLTFDEAYSVFREQIQAVVDGGVDIINFETFSDLAEMRVALLAAKEMTELPVICSMTFEQNGKTLMGNDPRIAVQVLKSLGADMVGVNCSLGPKQLLRVTEIMHKAKAGPISVKPNAGLPAVVEGRTIYGEVPETFSEVAGEYINHGARLIGGCCGTTPEFIREIKKKLKDIRPPEVHYIQEEVITSSQELFELKDREKIDAICIKQETITKIVQMLQNNDMEAIADIALEVSSEKGGAVYINIGRLAVDSESLAGAVNAMQLYIKTPFIIDTDDPEVLDKALRIYKGRAGVVIDECLGIRNDKALSVAKKYGSAIVRKEAISKTACY